ncbi:MAG TPA: hypothetical protein ENH29_03760 [Bacteroidetes bacterium]|nr:hypothetical protein [Bacteroidota bacterium]
MNVEKNIAKKGEETIIGQNWVTSPQITGQLATGVRQLYYWELKGIVEPKTVTMGAREFNVTHRRI